MIIVETWIPDIIRSIVNTPNDTEATINNQHTNDGVENHKGGYDWINLYLTPETFASSRQNEHQRKSQRHLFDYILKKK